MTVLNISNNNEYQYILNNNTYIVVIFSAKFCKPCCEFYPSMIELSETYGNITFIKIDIQECDDIEDINNIVTIPHFKFIKNKCELFSFSGANKPIIIDTIKKLLKEDD
jgi:thiol-disulfide isomerase/thioredoxin